MPELIAFVQGFHRLLLLNIERICSDDLVPKKKLSDFARNVASRMQDATNVEVGAKTSMRGICIARTPRQQVTLRFCDLESAMSTFLSNSELDTPSLLSCISLLKSASRGRISETLVIRYFRPSCEGARQCPQSRWSKGSLFSPFK